MVRWRLRRVGVFRVLLAVLRPLLEGFHLLDTLVELGQFVALVNPVFPVLHGLRRLAILALFQEAADAPLEHGFSQNSCRLPTFSAI